MATVVVLPLPLTPITRMTQGWCPSVANKASTPPQSAVDGVDKNVRAGRLFADRLPDFVNQRLRGGDADIADNQTVAPLVPVFPRRRRHPLSRAQQAGEDIGHGKGSAIEPKVAPSDIAGLSVGMQDL